MTTSLFEFRTLLFLSCVAALLWGASPAGAHESRPAYLELRETAPGKFNVLWRTPVLAGSRLPIVLGMPADVKEVKERTVQELADSLVERRWIDAGPNGLAGRRIEFAGLQLTITDVLVRVELLDGRRWAAIARPSQPWVEIVGSTAPPVEVEFYVAEGIRHVLFGVDHLLFVFGLLLIVKDRWLMKTLIAFVVGHSLTLAVATLGYAEIPALPLNAAIALSVLFVGGEIVRSWRGGTSFAIERPWVVAFLFGAIHGFGFSRALTMASLPPAQIPLALLSFNAGIEIGLAAFVLLVVVVERPLRRLRIGWPRWVELLPGYVVGSFGALWTIQRAALLLAGR